MFFSRCAMIVYKTTGGRRWIPRSGLPPLSPTQQRNRRRNAEATLKNLSVLKMAAANEPEEPTRLFKPLNHWRLMWMRQRMQTSREILGSAGTEGAASNQFLHAKLKALSAALSDAQKRAGQLPQ